MTPEQRTRLISVLKRKREEMGLSVAELARRADLDVGTVWHIENGTTASPKAESLQAIANALGIPAFDLFAPAGWMPGADLPTIRPYLRSKYHQLPPNALLEIEIYFDEVARRHGISFDSDHGPQNQEDE